MSNARNTLVLVALGAFALSAGGAFAEQPAGPEPYRAPDPQYTPMKSEPMLPKSDTAPAPELTSGKTVNGPAAGPEPYHAPDPSY